MLQKRKIGIFCEKWESGGIESFLSNILTQIDLSGLSVDIIAAELCNSVFTKRLEELGIRFYELSGSQRKLLSNYRAFTRRLAEGKYDVFHFNLFQGLSLFYVWLAKQAGIPVRIAHSHNSALRKSGTRGVKMAVHYCARELFAGCATHLWACSEMAARFLFPSKILKRRGFQFVPNGIKTRRFRYDPIRRDSVRAELGLTDAFVVGNVGRLCYQKNQDFLLDVLAALLDIRPESRLLLIGEGEQEALLKEKAARLGMEEQVLFYGVSEHVEELFWAMDVFLFPSRFEGLGIVAIEAQAAALPVLCSEHIPEEANATELFHRLPIGAGEKKWAETAAALCADDRKLMAEKVCLPDYDIEDVVQLVKACYLG